MKAQAVAPVTDQVLAERIMGAGDESAFRELYHRYTPRLYQFVLRVMGGDELEGPSGCSRPAIAGTRDRDRDVRFTHQDTHGRPEVV